MNEVSVSVFWLDQNLNPQSRSFSSALDQDPMRLAMALMEEKRRDGMRHVCMSVENAYSVGKPGVDTIKDGKTPDGEVYDWSKQHRAGKERRR